MKILNMQQKSQEWLDYRKTKITGTDMSKVLNLNPWENAVDLWKKKVGISEDVFPVNEAIQRGNDYEDDARFFVNRELKTEFFDAVIQSDEAPWLMASLDGLDADYFCEIKIPLPHNFESQIAEPIPKHYMIQLQTAFAASDGFLQAGYFCVYSPEDNLINIRKVLPDKKMINTILKESEIFWRRIREFDCPPGLHRVIETKQMADYVDEYRLACNMVARAEKMKDEAKEKLIALSDGDCIEGFGLKLTKYWRKGSVDYKIIPELKTIDLEKYRKDASEQIRISINKCT